jgi:hypothetical protein
MGKKYLEREKFYWFKILIDGILLSGSFLGIYYVKREHIQVEADFQAYFILLAIAWLISTLFSKKFMKVEGEEYFQQIRPFLVSIIALTVLVSLAILVLGWYHLSRFIVYGTIAGFLVLENVYLSIRNYRLWRIGVIKSIPFSVVFFLMELLIISGTFALIYFYRKGTIKIKEDYFVLLIGIFFVWFIASLLIHKFDIKMDAKFLNVIFPFWKSEVIIVGLVAYFIYFLSLATFSRFIILGSLLVFALAENLIVILYFYRHRPRLAEDNPISFFRVAEADFEPDSEIQQIGPSKMEKYKIPGSQISSKVLLKQLRTVYLSHFPELLDFLNENIDLSRIDIDRAAVLFTRNPYNFEILKDNSLHLFLNLRKANDFRRINHNFIKINQKLKKGGIYVGRFEGKIQQRQRYKETYPLVVARILLFFHFLFVRVLPKLPLLKKIYFFITRGRGRAVSQAEILGRLVFCGFEILSIAEIEHQTWFIVKKTKAPNGDKNPSYGLIFKQKRVGRRGNMIFMLKLRTMHPYSEYIHHYVLENYPLDDSGKVKDDFRVTGWGRVLRRLYIDELPMLINWVKRNVKLVGVRPISESFFSTYPKDLQKERIKYKPGLIPPYYADMPANIKEVWKSEREYLKKYKKHPWRTDFVYLFKALNNIFFHHAKSS